MPAQGLAAGVYVPLVTEVGYCTSCGANVRVDARGRCPVDGVLAIYRDDRPRPPIVTETLLLLRDIDAAHRFRARATADGRVAGG